MDKLVEIKQMLDKGETPAAVTVREFLSWFGAFRRGWLVVQVIDDALAYYGLETSPYFNHVYIDSEIEFKKRTDEAKSTTSTTTTTTTEFPEDTLSSDGAEASFNDPTYRIGKLTTANKSLTFVKPDSELSEAVTKMITFDFSQLPVMQQQTRGLKGVISWRSIGLNFSQGKKSIRVGDLMEVPHVISSDTSLFSALPTIIEHDYVLIENNTKEITGIVTASDLSFQFKQMTEPFLIVSEIENHVRLILSKLPKEDVENAKDERDTDRIINSVTDLNFGEYIRLFQSPVTWTKLNLLIDRKTFCEHLEKVRVIRNDIMHFDPDPYDEEDIETLRRMGHLLQTLRNIKAI